jgi:hypothetical protein
VGIPFTVLGFLLPLESCRLEPEAIQRKLVELVWHLSIWSEDNMILLSRVVNSGTFSAQVKQYLVQIVHHR